MRFIVVGLLLMAVPAQAAIVAQGPFGPPSITANPPHVGPFRGQPTGVNFGHAATGFGHGSCGHGHGGK